MLDVLLKKAYQELVHLLSDEHVLAQESNIKKNELPGFILYLSLSNAREKTKVVTVSGNDFQSAWSKAVGECISITPDNTHSVKWLRVDWATKVQAISFKKFNDLLSRTKRNYFRYGISFSNNFECSLLEQELNANAILYSGSHIPHASLNIENLNAYFKKRFDQPFTLDIKENDLIYVLSTAGRFYSMDESINDLPGSSDKGIPLAGPGRNGGRRQPGPLNAAQVFSLVDYGAAFLSRQVMPDGKFIYGYFPCFGRKIANYNALRHASTTYAMLEAWELTQSAELKNAIDRALAYLVNELIHTYSLNSDQQVAYLVDTGNEIKLGGNAVCLLVMVKYTELTGDERYLILMESLAAGIELMQHPDTGQFVHVLNSDDLSIKEQFRIIYYDGEAAFGLMRLYGLTKNERWLKLVEHAFNYFIDNGHWQAHDHWLSYCVNELTRYRPEEKYFRFAVNNISGYLDFIKNRRTTYPTLLELSMAFHHTLGRIKQLPEMQHLLQDFDENEFYTALHARANYLMNGFFWPEFAMYFAEPQTILGSFFIRHHSFRVRIDDVEHYLSGYVAYHNFLKKSYDVILKDIGSEGGDVYWTKDHLRRATNGRWLREPSSDNWRATGLCITENTMRPGCIAAVKGVNDKTFIKAERIEYLPFLPQALLVSDESVVDKSDIPTILVNNVRKAIIDAGKYARLKTKAKVIGVTGSAGKTTMVAMLQHILKPWGKVNKTEHNANLPVGIAWNLASMSWDSDYIVVEMAIGQMQTNASLALPQVAVLTNIHPAHLEYHKSTEDIARKKSLIFSKMAPGGVAVINRDLLEWELVSSIALHYGAKIISFGTHVDSDIRLVDFNAESKEVIVSCRNREHFRFAMGSPGEHMVMNALACFSVVESLGLDVTVAAAMMPLFSAVKGRGEVLCCKLRNTTFYLIDDAYNANPASMKAAINMCGLSSFSFKPVRNLFLLGDMLELGGHALDYHMGLVPEIVKSSPDKVYLVGECMKELVPVLLDRDIPCVWFENVDVVINSLEKDLQDGDLLLIKSSNGTGLHKVVDSLKRLSLSYSSIK